MEKASIGGSYGVSPRVRRLVLVLSVVALVSVVVSCFAGFRGFALVMMLIVAVFDFAGKLAVEFYDVKPSPWLGRLKSLSLAVPFALNVAFTVVILLTLGYSVGFDGWWYWALVVFWVWCDISDFRERKAAKRKTDADGVDAG